MTLETSVSYVGCQHEIGSSLQTMLMFWSELLVLKF